MNTKLEKKYSCLIEELQALGKVAIAFSGGVDSTLLLEIAHRTLGTNAVAVTVVSDFFPKTEAAEAHEFCKRRGIEHITCEVDILSSDEVAQNTPDRCYVCKKHIFGRIIEAANALGITNVLDGTNADDGNDFRPGVRALEELGVISPLANAQLTKAEIYELSRELHLPTAHKPAMACLATRFPVNETLTRDKLLLVERAEALLHEMGFSQVRARHHGDVLRIEVDEAEIPQFLAYDVRNKAVREMQGLGYKYVSLDLEGYIMGNMNSKTQPKHSGQRQDTDKD